MPTADERRRAQRFPLHLPLTLKWQEEKGEVPEPATSHDISANGVYFLVSHDLKPDSKVEFYVRLTEGFENGGVTLHCVGSVVRVDSKESDRIGIAVRIDRHRFMRPGEAPGEARAEDVA